MDRYCVGTVQYWHFIPHCLVAASIHCSVAATIPRRHCICTACLQLQPARQTAPLSLSLSLSLHFWFLPTLLCSARRICRQSYDINININIVNNLNIPELRLHLLHLSTSKPTAYYHLPYRSAFSLLRSTRDPQIPPRKADTEPTI